MFISDKEREKLVHKHNSNNPFKRTVVFIACICGALLSAYAFTMLLVQLGDVSDPNIQFIRDNNQLTVTGWIFAILLGLTFATALPGIFFAFAIRSAKKGAEISAKLASSALSGKKLSDNAAADYKARASRPSETKTAKVDK